MRNNIIGVVGDNVNLFVFPSVYNRGVILRNIISPNLQPLILLNDSQPIIWGVYYFFASKTDPILFYNIFVSLTILLNIILTYWFLRHYTNHKSIVWAVTIIFNASGYFVYRYRQHLDLAQIWVTLFFLGLYLNKSFKYKQLSLGVLLALIAGISNYLAYLLLIFITAHLFSKYIYGALFRDATYLSLDSLKNYFVLLVVFAFFAFFILRGYLSDNIHIDNGTISTEQSFTIRSFEDFTIFSSRPWYYVLPSVDNPFYGEISEKFIDFLQYKWGYFLAQNYFKSEHTSTYLGITNIILGFFGVIYIKNNKKKNRGSFYILILTSIILIILTMPPLITISGINIYMPSYLLYTIFPMFRTLSRLGIYILLILLIFSLYGLVDIKNRLHNMAYAHPKIYGLKHTCSPILIIFFLLAMSEFWVPMKITNVSGGTEIFKNLGADKIGIAELITYPQNKEILGYITFPYHRQRISNPDDFCGYIKTAKNKLILVSVDESLEKESCFSEINDAQLYKEYINTVTKNNNLYNKNKVIHISTFFNYNKVAAYTLEPHE